MRTPSGETAKSTYVNHYGPPEVVEFREVARPVPRPGQLRIRVLAAAVTAADWRVRSGILPRGFGALRGLALGFRGPRQAVMGTDAAGVVDAVGKGVAEFAVGDAVVAFPGAQQGAHAEFLIMPAKGKVVRKPASLSFQQAAAIPFGAMTALDFFRRGNVRSGESVLVNGASGNVGTAAIQIAKHLGAHVTAVCSRRNTSLVRSLGADEVIDYADSDLAAGPARFDVIVDAVGNAPYARVKPVLLPGGRLLVVLGDLPALLGSVLTGRPHGHRVIAGPATERLADLLTTVELVERGALVPVIDRVFPFERIHDAYRVVDSGRKVGSVILTFDTGLSRNRGEPFTPGSTGARDLTNDPQL